jgi:tripartite-type tricarboxylate transporter receptor subunit TctC
MYQPKFALIVGLVGLLLSIPVLNIIGRHISGNPSFIVHNMPGGAGIIAQNYLYKVSKADGLTIGLLNRFIALQQFAGYEEVQYDSARFEWIGSASQEQTVAVARHDTPFRRLKDVIGSQGPLIVGSTGPGADSDIYPRALKAALNANFKIVSGYRGTSGLRLALERGEIKGIVGWSWFSFKTTAADYLEKKYVNILADLSPRRSDELKDRGVPWVFDLPLPEASRTLLEIFFSPLSIGRPFAAPPGVPSERINILRNAFAKTMQDPRFLAEAEQSKMEIRPLTGEEIQKLMRKISSANPRILEQASAIFKGGE